MNESAQIPAAASLPGKPGGVAHGIGLFRFSAAQLLFSLILLYVGYAYLQSLPFGDILASILLTVVLLTAVLTVGSGKKELWISISLGVPPLITEWARHAWPGLLPSWLTDASVLAFIVYAVSQILRGILRTRAVDQEILCAGASVYFLLVLAWSFAYRVEADLVPGAFTVHTDNTDYDVTEGGLTPFDSLYYSAVTMTTLGCNDITPVARTARTLTMLQVTMGMFYATVFIARLLALYSRKINQPVPPPESGSRDKV